MMPSTKKLAVALAALSALSLTAACGAGDGNAEAASDNMSDQTSADAGTKSTEATGLVGPGCDDYAKMVPDGAGSVQGMGQDRVAEAASNNPLLTTLTAAVSGKLNPRVDLVKTLDGDQFTVFAPVDDAFGKLPKKTVSSLAKPKNAEQLKAVLTYHVVPGRIAPDDIAGEQTTVQGSTVEVSGSGSDLKVNDAKVICGGVQTANATVYLVDSVLMPPM